MAVKTHETKSVTRLTATRTVLFHHPQNWEGDRPGFRPDHIEDARSTEITLDPDVWRDMGRPNLITVTIEPGDRLND